MKHIKGRGLRLRKTDKIMIYCEWSRYKYPKIPDVTESPDSGQLHNPGYIPGVYPKIPSVSDNF